VDPPHTATLCAWISTHQSTNFSAPVTLAKTSWAWRFTPVPYRLDYRAFAVVYNYEDVASGKVDVLRDLTVMPTRHPARFKSLRRGLQRASAWMRYSFSDCGTPSCDAFRVLQEYIESL
jgi:hypothetical protein